MHSSDIVARVRALQDCFRATPVVRLQHDHINLFAKLEQFNMTGSIKDRPAFWMLKTAIENGSVGRDTTIVESSSGNMAVALATYCRILGLRFVPVIDPKISVMYETLLRTMCTSVEKVTAPDAAGGYLLSRLRRVSELQESLGDTFWPNQYGNPAAAEGHARLTGQEIFDTFPKLDFAFVAVSSAGTIAGISQALKSRYKNIKIIAVDAVGSVIFGGPARNRHVQGIGSAIVPDLLRSALIDDVIHVSDLEAVAGCHELLGTHNLLVGGSSGSSYSAVMRYFRASTGRTPNVLFFCCDRGTSYMDTIYNKAWVRRLQRMAEEEISYDQAHESQAA